MWLYIELPPPPNQQIIIIIICHRSHVSNRLATLTESSDTWQRDYSLPDKWSIPMKLSCIELNCYVTDASSSAMNDDRSGVHDKMVLKVKRRLDSEFTFAFVVSAVHLTVDYEMPQQRSLSLFTRRVWVPLLVFTGNELLILICS